MRRLWKMISGNIDRWDILAALGFSVLVWSWTDGTKRGITGILGGISTENGNTIELVPLGKWLFLFAFYFLIICRRLYQTKSNLTFALYRYRSFKRWWRHSFMMIHLTDLLIFIGTCAVWGIFGLLSGNPDGEAIAVLAVFSLHLSVWVSILALGNVVFERQLMPCVLLILEGMLYILSVNYDQPVLACGMYVRCACAPPGIAAAVYGAEALIIMVCYFTAPKLWESEYLERKGL